MRGSVLPAGLAAPSLCFKLLGLLLILLKCKKEERAEAQFLCRTSLVEGKLGNAIADQKQLSRADVNMMMMEIKPKCKPKEMVWSRISYGPKPKGIQLGQWCFSWKPLLRFITDFWDTGALEIGQPPNAKNKPWPDLASSLCCNYTRLCMSQEESCRRGRERQGLCGLPWSEVKKAQSATTSTQLLQVFLDRFRIHFFSEK